MKRIQIDVLRKIRVSKDKDHFKGQAQIKLDLSWNNQIKKNCLALLVEFWQNVQMLWKVGEPFLVFFGSCIFFLIQKLVSHDKDGCSGQAEANIVLSWNNYSTGCTCFICQSTGER